MTNVLTQEDIKLVVDQDGVRQEVLIRYEKFLEIMDLLEDREDEVNARLGNRIEEERKAYLSGQGRSLKAFLAELGE